MIPIALQYSNDNGSTWSTALGLDADVLRIDKTFNGSNRVNAITGRKYPAKFAYWQVTLRPSYDHFDPSDATHGATANDNWAELEEIVQGHLVRLYITNTTAWPTIQGKTLFNSSTNTNYLLLESEGIVQPDMDGAGTSGRILRTRSMVFTTRDAI